MIRDYYEDIWLNFLKCFLTAKNPVRRFPLQRLSIESWFRAINRSVHKKPWWILRIESKTQFYFNLKNITFMTIWFQSRRLLIYVNFPKRNFFCQRILMLVIPNHNCWEIIIINYTFSIIFTLKWQNYQILVEKSVKNILIKLSYLKIWNLGFWKIAVV